MWEPTDVPTIAELIARVDTRVAGLRDQKARLCQAIVRHALCEGPGANLILLGPTGGGKTHLARTACEMSGLPWCEVNATQFTVAGMIGEDLPNLFLGLLEPPWVQPGERQQAMIPHAERFGIVIIDEIDKWRIVSGEARERAIGRDMQFELLKVLEGDTVYPTRQRDRRGQAMRTHNILFIGVGAFEGLNEDMYRHYGTSATHEYLHVEPVDIQHFGFIMELVGRFPSLVPLPPLDPVAMARVFRDHVLPRYIAEAQALGVTLVVPDEAVMEIAGRAIAKQTGARGFAAIMESYLALPFARSKPGDTLRLDVAAVLGGHATREAA